MPPETMTPEKGFDKIPEALTTKPVIRMANFRVSQNEFRMGKLAIQFSKLMVSEIVWMVQTESDGNVSFTICYR